jgi:hypothetical protein
MAKFKWIGGNGYKDIDLVLNKVMKPQQQLFNGMIIDVPDSNEYLINRIKINGNYEVYNEPKKVIKPKKEKKDKKEEK